MRGASGGGSTKGGEALAPSPTRRALLADEALRAVEVEFEMATQLVLQQSAAAAAAKAAKAATAARGGGAAGGASPSALVAAASLLFAPSPPPSPSSLTTATAVKAGATTGAAGARAQLFAPHGATDDGEDTESNDDGGFLSGSSSSSEVGGGAAPSAAVAASAAARFAVATVLQQAVAQEVELSSPDRGADDVDFFALAPGDAPAPVPSFSDPAAATAFQNGDPLFCPQRGAEPSPPSISVPALPDVVAEAARGSPPAGAAHEPLLVKSGADASGGGGVGGGDEGASAAQEFKSPAQLLRSASDAAETLQAFAASLARAAPAAPSGRVVTGGESTAFPPLQQTQRQGSSAAVSPAALIRSPSELPEPGTPPLGPLPRQLLGRPPLPSNLGRSGGSGGASAPARVNGGPVPSPSFLAPERFAELFAVRGRDTEGSCRSAHSAPCRFFVRFERCSSRRDWSVPVLHGSPPGISVKEKADGSYRSPLRCGFADVLFSLS